MNTKPDEMLLALWVEDELSGNGVAEVEAWAATRPEWLARREEARACRALLPRALPATEDPPFAEFFQSRVEHAVRLQVAAGARETPRAVGGFWRWLALPAAAAMALCFWAGTRFAPVAVPAAAAGEAPAQAPSPAPAMNLYVPEQGVQAKVIESSGSQAVVIVLDGVSAIPDAVEIPSQAGPPPASKPASATSTAAAGEGPENQPRTQ